MIVHGFCSGFSRLSLRDDDDDDDDDTDKDDDGDDDGVQYVNKGCKQLPSNVFADRSGSWNKG